MKKFIIAVALIFTVSLAILWLLPYFNGNGFKYLGTIEVTKVDIPARISSVIDELLVEEGDKVQKEQQLIILDGQEVKIKAEKAHIDMLRAEYLHHTDVISDEDYDKIKTEYDMAQLHLKWADIFSPLSGTVFNKYHEPGEYVYPGDKLLTIANLDEVWSYIYVPFEMLGYIKRGQEVKGIIPFSDEKTATGTITFISDQAEFTPKNVQTLKQRTRLVYEVKVTFDNHQQVLKPGMSIEIELPTKP
ncbi:MAG: HlyD family secretion protein [Chlamydiota bacterium]